MARNVWDIDEDNDIGRWWPWWVFCAAAVAWALVVLVWRLC